MNRDLAATAALFSDPARASMVIALMNGLVLPASQLAMIANISPQTASSHLSKLTAGQILAVEQQGRHRYFRLANAEVAAAIETLLAISPRNGNGAQFPERRPIGRVGTLAYARTCYSHLAGQLAVRIAEMLEKQSMLVPAGARAYKITGVGREWLRTLGIEARASEVDDPRFARRCLDWTERRHHIAGGLGSALLLGFRELKWIAPLRGTRAVRVTLEGRQKLEDLLSVRRPTLASNY